MDVQKPLANKRESVRHLQRLIRLASMGLGLLLTGCSPPSASGTYLAKFTNGLARLELVQAGDHTITGEIDWALYDSAGKFSTKSASVTGAIDGQSLNLTFKGNSFLAGTSTGAGELGWSGLALTGDFNGGTLSTVSFERTNASEYQIELLKAKSAANAIITLRAQTEARQRQAALKIDFLKKFSNLIARLQGFDRGAEVYLQRLPKAENALLAITSDMQKKLDRERQLSGNYYNVARGQISVAISQDSVSMEQLHNGLEPLRTSFTTEVVPVLNTAEQMQALCSRSTRPAYFADTCAKLSNTLQLAAPKLHALSARLDHLEDVYQQQQREQQDIIREANAAE